MKISEKEIEKLLKELKKEGNKLLKEQKRRYGYLRGFKKEPIKKLLQNELDGGDEVDVSTFELNDFKMPR